MISGSKPVDSHRSDQWKMFLENHILSEKDGCCHKGRI